MSALSDPSDRYSGTGCALLVPLKRWCRRVPQELIAAQFPLDRIVDIDGTLHLRLPVGAGFTDTPDPAADAQMIAWARNDLRRTRGRGRDTPTANEAA